MLKAKKSMSILLVLMLALSFALAGCGGQSSGDDQSDASGSEESKLKIAMVTEGAINDGGWNAGAHQGLMQIKEEFGAETAFTEKVARADMEQVLRTYARQGYQLIFGHGYQWDEPMKTVAAEFPDTKFVVINGSAQGENLFSTNFKFGELGYFTGMTAGLMTKSNKIGVVAAMDAPTLVADVDTFKEGIAEVNPEAEVMVSYVGSWEDIPKAKEAGIAQLSKGADVVLVIGNAFSVGVFQAAEEHGALAIGWSDDQNSMAPETVITSGGQDVPSVYVLMAGLFAENKLESKTYTFGMKDGAQFVAPFNDKVPQEVRDQVDQAVQDYLDGKLTLDLKY